jgi:hypothetical protein
MYSYVVVWRSGWNTCISPRRLIGFGYDLLSAKEIVASTNATGGRASQLRWDDRKPHQFTSFKVKIQSRGGAIKLDEESDEQVSSRVCSPETGFR